MNQVALLERARRRHRQRTVVGDGCWMWTTPINDQGYGAFAVRRDTKTAHRWAYILFVGPVPDDLEVDHICNVHGCVRPDHLQLLTQAENLAKRQFDYVDDSIRCDRGHLEWTRSVDAFGRPRRWCRGCAREAKRLKVSA